MASNGTYVSDQELTELYNSLEKGSLVKMLIEKHRQLEKQVKKLTIPVVVSTSNCEHNWKKNDNFSSKEYCSKCYETRYK